MTQLIHSVLLDNFRAFKPEFHLGRLVHLSRWEHADLRNPDWRFYYNSTDQADVKLVGKAWQTLESDFVYLVPPETAFASRNRGPFRQLYVHFQLPLGQPADRTQHFIQAPLAEAAPRYRRILENISGDIAPRPKDLLAVLSWALTYIPDSLTSEDAPDAAFCRVLDYLRATLQFNPTNAQLAEQGGMSENTLIRQFHRYLGVSPQQHLQRLRIERACRLLLATSKTIDKIAEECGFCDRYYFSKIFKKQRGIGPAGFRKQFTF